MEEIVNFDNVLIAIAVVEVFVVSISPGNWMVGGDLGISSEESFNDVT